MPIKRVWAPRIDFSVLRSELKLPTDFPAEALREAEQAASATPLPTADRTDIPFVTVDPAASRDLDQAMHLSHGPDGGYRVLYAIADVAAYVQPGGPLEAETWVRGQTIYLPDGNVPLHPPVLSEGAASLLPGQVRPSVLWSIDLNSDGEPTQIRVRRALVRSIAQFDYDGVQATIDAGNPHPSIAGLPALGRLRREHAVRCESEIHRVQVLERTQHETRRREQHDGQRELRHDQDVPRAARHDRPDGRTLVQAALNIEA